MYIRDLRANGLAGVGFGQPAIYGTNDEWRTVNPGLGQAPLQHFGPAAIQSRQPFELTSEQIKTVLQSLRHAPGAETFFYIHADASGREAAFKFGEARAAAEGVLHQSDFNWGA